MHTRDEEKCRQTRQCWTNIANSSRQNCATATFGLRMGGSTPSREISAGVTCSKHKAQGVQEAFTFWTVECYTCNHRTEDSMRTRFVSLCDVERKGYLQAMIFFLIFNVRRRTWLSKVRIGSLCRVHCCCVWKGISRRQVATKRARVTRPRSKSHEKALKVPCGGRQTRRRSPRWRRRCSGC